MLFKFRERVIDWKPINDRICYLRVRGYFYNYSIISVYAPHNLHEDSTKDQFYDQLDKLVGSCPKYDALMILGDFNAKVGSKCGSNEAVGQFSLHGESNENGSRLTDFALSRGLVVSSTRFPHRKIHLETWKIPGKQKVNQIDHVLIDARHATRICLYLNEGIKSD